MLSLFLFSSGETSSTGISYCTLGKGGEPKQSDYTPRPREQRKHKLGEAWVFLWWSSSKAKPLACVLPAEPAAWGAFCHAARRLCCGWLCPAVAGPAGRGLGTPLFLRRPGGAGGLSVRHQGQGEVRCKTGSNDLKAAKQKAHLEFRKTNEQLRKQYICSPKILTKERWRRPAQETPPTGSAPECDRRLHTVSRPPRPQPEQARRDGQETPVLHSMSGKPTTDCGQGGGYCSHLRVLPWFAALSPVNGAVGGQRRADPTLWTWPAWMCSLWTRKRPARPRHPWAMVSRTVPACSPGHITASPQRPEWREHHPRPSIPRGGKRPVPLLLRLVGHS